MSDREGILFFQSWREAIRELPADIRVNAYEAILDYAFYGTEPEVSGMVKAIFLMAKPTIDKNEKAYRDGKRGGRPPTKNHGYDNKKTMVYENEKPSFSKIKTTETETETETETVTETEADNDINTSNRNTLAHDFDEVWELYPRKQGKKSAFESYKRAVKDGATQEQIRDGILAYKQYITESQIDSQYVKQGSTFFSQRAWQDDWTPRRPRNTNRPLTHEEMMQAAERIEAGGTAHDWGGNT